MADPVYEPDPNRQRLIDILTAPDEQGPPPQVDKPNALAMALSGIGDSLNSFNAARRGDPGLRSDYFQQYLSNLDQQKESLRKYQTKLAESQSASKKSRAQFLLADQDIQAAKADAKIQAEQDRIARQKEKEQEATLKQADITAENLRNEARIKGENERARLSRITDVSVARIHARAAAGDEHAKFDQKALPEVMGLLSDLADGTQTALSGGDVAAKIPSMTPDQIEARKRRIIEGSGLSPDAKAAAYAFAEREVGGELTSFQQKQASQSQQGTTVEGQGILSKMGDVLSGKTNLYNPGP